AWGDAIEEGRKQALWGRLRAWWEEQEHGERKGPFAGEELTGAEVFWLAVCVVAQQRGTSTDVAEERLRNRSPHNDLGMLSLQGGAPARGAVAGGEPVRGAVAGGGPALRADEGGGPGGASFDKRTSMDHALLADVRLDGVIFDNTNLSVVDWSRVRRLQDERIARHARFGEEVETWDPEKRGKRKSRDERNGEYQAAAWAYRLLVVALQAKGMSEAAAGYAYRAQLMQRGVYRYSGGVRGGRGCSRGSCG
ncbi:MAG TPA: hypothetical protein VMV29_18140, partial [Ktedonobacterales bacterium]|nr:hypothetical protein [Ktedonobacterales bacterium]